MARGRRILRVCTEPKVDQCRKRERRSVTDLIFVIIKNLKRHLGRPHPHELPVLSSGVRDAQGHCRELSVTHQFDQFRRCGRPNAEVVRRLHFERHVQRRIAEAIGRLQCGSIKRHLQGAACTRATGGGAERVVMEIRVSIAIGIDVGSRDQRVNNFGLREMLIQPPCILLEDHGAVLRTGTTTGILADPPTQSTIPIVPMGCFIFYHQGIPTAVGGGEPAVVVGELQDVLSDGIVELHRLSVVVEASAVLTGDEGGRNTGVAQREGRRIRHHQKMRPGGEEGAGGKDKVDAVHEAGSAQVDGGGADVLQLHKLKEVVVAIAVGDLSRARVGGMIVEFGDAEELLQVSR